MKRNIILTVLVGLLLTGCHTSNTVPAAPTPVSKCDLTNGWEDGFGACHCNPFYESDPISEKCIRQEESEKKEEKTAIQCPENTTLTNGVCLCSYGLTWDDSTQSCYKMAFISILNKDSYRDYSKPVFLYGETSDNCTGITVIAENQTAGIHDQYSLTEYKKGQTTFKYGISLKWENEDPNLGIGKNSYTFIANCDNNQAVTDTFEITYPQRTTITPSFEYSAPVIPIYNFSEENDYDNGYEWAEDNDISDFDECQDEFGTGDAENGCNEYVKENYSGYKTFYGNECTEDCSGHEAGYDWAEENDIDDVDDCGGNSGSFIEGCESYVDENY